jgi:hypothetical protein
MKKTLLAVASAITSVVLAAPAQALLVAGWDFSPYFGDGLLSTDGATYTDTLPANYSALDPSGLGPESAGYGTLYLNGQFGSSNVGAGSGSEPFLPTAALGGSLASNLDAPVADGVLPFDSLNNLIFEGQPFANSLAMIAPGAVSLVFAADLTGAEPGTDWVLSLGGRAFSGSETVGVEFSTDGVQYAAVGSLSLTTIDTPFSLALASAPSERGFVRLVFDQPDGPNQAVIDNVAISATLVPEPGTALLLLSGLAGLTVQGRRRG